MCIRDRAQGGGRFPVKYFLTAMLFIIFDIEIVFLYPWAVAFDQLALFGLRNTQDYKRALSEALRVTKPGGRIVIVEFSTPTFKPFRILYMNYLMKALPKLSRSGSSNPAAYGYLAESIRAWPKQEELARDMEAVGWKNSSWINLTGGVVAVHTAFKGS